MVGKRRGSGRPDHRRFLTNFNYSISEAAELLGVHSNTVRNHIQRGLPCLKTTVGILILGSEARVYFATLKAKAKRPCPPGTMYCLRCRAHRRPPTGLLELAQVGGAASNLRGICPDCGALMNRRVGRNGPESAGFSPP